MTDLICPARDVSIFIYENQYFAFLLLKKIVSEKLIFRLFINDFVLL
jgi:hypothetical protein